MPLLFYFIITLISGVSQGQTGIFNVVKGVGDGEGVHIFNPQLLIDHSTEANVISIFSFKNTEVVQLLFIFYTDFCDFPEPNVDLQYSTHL
jgi:hypothetical protein